MGLAVGGALAGWLLALYGYEANTELTASTLQGILMSFTLVPAVASILVAWVMRWYTLDQQKVEAVQAELQSAALCANVK